MRTRIAFLTAGAVLLAGTLMTVRTYSGDQASTPSSTAGNAGDLWNTTSQMSMEGMPMSMPAHSMKVCARHDAAQPPMASNPDQKCENTNFQRSASTVTWTTSCKNPQMTGEGQITYDSPDSYSGTIKFTSEGGAMTIKLTGKKIGTCDKPVD
jgi:hypothetical protein